MAQVPGCTCYDGADTPELEDYCACLDIGEPPTVVVNVSRGEKCDIYGGRGGPLNLGNPFIIGRDGNRAQVIEKFRLWAPTQKHIIDSLPLLKGKRIGCHCKPKPCHCDFYVELVRLHCG